MSTAYRILNYTSHMKDINHSSLNILLQDAQAIHDRIVQMTRDFDQSLSQRISTLAAKDNPTRNVQPCNDDEFSVSDGSSCQSAKTDFVDELAKPIKKTAFIS
uniref:Uncharacterized protein n=1 Tax=Romanomermis culicivorax TaxID=13658 RepID=A0A915KUY9_ROMCU